MTLVIRFDAFNNTCVKRAIFGAGCLATFDHKGMFYREGNVGKLCNLIQR